MRACNAPFFRVVKVFDKKSRPKDEPLGVRAGGRGSEWYKKNDDENSCVCEDFYC